MDDESEVCCFKNQIKQRQKERHTTWANCNCIVVSSPYIMSVKTSLLVMSLSVFWVISLMSITFNFQFGVLWQGKKIEDREHHVHKHYSQPEDWNQTWWDCRFANDEKMFLFCFVPFSFSIKDLLYRPFFGKTRQMWLLLNLASVKELAQDCCVSQSRWRFEDAYENGLLFQNTSSSTHTHTTRHWHINPADVRYGLLKQLVTTGLLS